MKRRQYHDDLIERLKDVEYAIGYLNIALDEEEKDVFLLALRNVAEAWGMTNLSRLSSIHRVSLYKMLSKQGNPSIESLIKLLQGMGLRIAIAKEEELKHAA